MKYKETILWAVKVGDEDWQEQIITTDESKIEEASNWAKENGYDRLRVAVIDLGVKPDFPGTINKFEMGGDINSEKMYIVTNGKDKGIIIGAKDAYEAKRIGNRRFYDSYPASMIGNKLESLNIVQLYEKDNNLFNSTNGSKTFDKVQFHFKGESGAGLQTLYNKSIDSELSDDQLEFIGKSKVNYIKFFNGTMYKRGGVVGQEIVFDDGGEENTGVIQEVNEITGDYIVDTDDGRTVLAQHEIDVISLGEMRNKSKDKPRKKLFGLFEDGGNINKSNNDPQFISYKNDEIMYVPYEKKYYANDMEFDSLEDAQKFLDSGGVNKHLMGAYKRGLFEDGGNLEDSSVNKLINDQINYIINLKSVSAKKEAISVLMNNIDDWSDSMTTKITKDNLKYALEQKTIGKINEVLKTSLNAIKYAKGGSVASNLKDSTYIPNRDIVSITIKKDGKNVKLTSKDILDGIYYKGVVGSKSTFQVDDIVYNTRTKNVGLVRLKSNAKGVTKTSADDNVNTSELEIYNPIKFPHQKDGKATASTTKEIDSRGLYNPYSTDENYLKSLNTPSNREMKYAIEFFTDGGIGMKYIIDNKFDAKYFKSSMKERLSKISWVDKYNRLESTIKHWARELGINNSKYIGGEIIETVDFINDSTERAEYLFSILDKNKMAKEGVSSSTGWKHKTK